MPKGSDISTILEFNIILLPQPKTENLAIKLRVIWAEKVLPRREVKKNRCLYYLTGAFRGFRYKIHFRRVIN